MENKIDHSIITISNIFVAFTRIWFILFVFGKEWGWEEWEELM